MCILLGLENLQDRKGYICPINVDYMKKSEHISKTYSWGEPLGSPTNRIVLFHIRYFLKEETKYCQIILCF